MNDDTQAAPEAQGEDKCHAVLVEWSGLPDHEPTRKAFLDAIEHSSIPDACKEIAAQLVACCESCEAAVPRDEEPRNRFHSESCPLFDPSVG